VTVPDLCQSRKTFFAQGLPPDLADEEQTSPSRSGPTGCDAYCILQGSWQAPVRRDRRSRDSARCGSRRAAWISGSLLLVRREVRLSYSNEFNPNNCNASDSPTKPAQVPGHYTGCQGKDAPWYNIYDMSGNVEEWQRLLRAVRQRTARYMLHARRGLQR